MGCIEMQTRKCDLVHVFLINRNMGCIEIGQRVELRESFPQDKP